MKKVLLNVFVCTFLSSTVFLTSCYTYTSVVGEGAKGKEKETRWNHYVIAGLVPVAVSDSKAMAAGVKDYTVTTKHTFLTGLVSMITIGIYTPTSTTVRK